MSKKKLTNGQKNSMAFQRMQNQGEIAKKLEEKAKKKTVWERRNQTENEYKKRPEKLDYNGTSTLNDEEFAIQLESREKDFNKKEPNPESIQTLKRNLRLVKGTGKIIIEGKLQKITSKLVRKRLAKTS